MNDIMIWRWIFVQTGTPVSDQNVSVSSIKNISYWICSKNEFLDKMLFLERFIDLKCSKRYQKMEIIDIVRGGLVGFEFQMLQKVNFQKNEIKLS